MLFKKNGEGEFVKETLTRGKELILLAYQWPENYRSTLLQTVEQVLLSKKFKINRAIIESQSLEVNTYRPSCELEIAKCQNLLMSFSKPYVPKSAFVPVPSSDVLMSCHEIILNLIQYVCKQLDIAIPYIFSMKPSLGWADMIYRSARVSKDPKLILHQINFFIEKQNIPNR